MNRDELVRTVTYGLKDGSSAIDSLRLGVSIIEKIRGKAPDHTWPPSVLDADFSEDDAKMLIDSVKNFLDTVDKGDVAVGTAIWFLQKTYDSSLLPMLNSLLAVLVEENQGAVFQCLYAIQSLGGVLPNEVVSSLDIEGNMVTAREYISKGSTIS